MSNSTIHTSELLAEHIMNQPYGTTIRHQTIEEITGERYKTSRFYGVVAKAKKILEEHGKMIAPVGGGDYKIAYPGDYTGAYAREVRLASKRIRHGGEILKGAPVKDMTQDEVQSFNRVSDFHMRLNASLAGSVAEVKKLTERKHPLEVAK